MKVTETCEGCSKELHYDIPLDDMLFHVEQEIYWCEECDDTDPDYNHEEWLRECGVNI